MRERRGEPVRGGCVDLRVEATDAEIRVVLAGDLDVRSTGLVRDAVYEQVRARDEHPHASVVIDISAVTSVDATALRVLAAASRQAHRYGVCLVLRGACPAVRRMLHLTRLIRFIEVERDEIAVG